MDIELQDIFPIAHNVRIDSHFAGSRTLHDWGEVASLQGSQLTIRLERTGEGITYFSRSNRHLFVRTGLQNRAYLCNAEVLAFSDEMLVLQLNGDIRPDELREYFRLDTLAPLTIVDDTAIHPSEIINISGGGCKARVRQALPVGEHLRLSLTLPSPQPQSISVEAKIVYCSPDLLPTGYTVGLSYADINERQRDAIICHINHEQMRLRQTSYRELFLQSTAA